MVSQLLKNRYTVDNLSRGEYDLLNKKILRRLANALVYKYGWNIGSTMVGCYGTMELRSQLSWIHIVA